MNFSASVKSSFQDHQVTVQTMHDVKQINIVPKASGYGSSVNGGELLLLALATCFCNDLYREADKLDIILDEVNVECTCNFGAEGEPGSNFLYNVQISSKASTQVITDLIAHTDKVAEIHNTLRKGVTVSLKS
ncbi:OsmC family protein [Mucilaginibacter flavus]|uniref:OsmC family protein n=1 Tax=Mucilaginibacter flavus TaxID=931504 RepID=UPI0025B5EAAB|nr:OsmC family protein [Mucilaginibacter flavus]MDN3580699.1 OsmC family protein [Mucilaginibacter flavus]